jgi:hypothetical protein
MPVVQYTVIRRTLSLLRLSVGDLIVVAALCLAGFKLAAGLENVLDLGLHDESNYLYSGVMLPAVGFVPTPDSPFRAPVYSIWYFGLSLLTPNHVALYFLNYKLGMVLGPVLIYMLLRINRVSAFVSLAAAVFWFLSRSNLNTVPRISHFTLAVILCTLIAVSYCRSWVSAVPVVALGALLVSYVRPEYFVAYVAALSGGGLVLLRAYSRKPERRTAILLAATLSTLTIMVALGSPLSAERSHDAFVQHFAKNWVRWTGSTLSSWTDTDEVIRQSLGDGSSLTDYVVSQPGMVLRHVVDNASRALPWSSSLIFPVYSPVDLMSKGLLALALLVAAYAARTSIRSALCTRASVLVAGSLFLLPGLISVVVVYPRDHYLLPVLGIIVSLAALAITPTSAYAASSSSLRWVVIATLLLAFMPRLYSSDNASQPNLETVWQIQALGIDAPVNLLEADGGYTIYLAPNFHRVKQFEKTIGFDEFLVTKEINMLVVSSALLSDSRFRNDPAWHAFLRYYASAGYTQIAIPNTDRIILVQTMLLE